MRLTVDSRPILLSRWERMLYGLRKLPELAALCAALAIAGQSLGQSHDSAIHRQRSTNAHRMRAARFLGGRARVVRGSVVSSINDARREQAAMVVAQASGGGASLNANWQAVGPNQIGSAMYGSVTGRVTAIAIDASDASGNTVYLGTTGGGVWKSTTAAGAASNASFTPLTDTITAFNPNAGASAIPSLSIGAISVQNGIVLAGTGDPNDALDSYYGSGVLRSDVGGTTWTLAQGSQDGVAGNHFFVGLGIAGFAWSTSSTSLVVMAVSDSLEGDLVNAADPINSVRGLYYSSDAGKTWQMSLVMDGSQTVQTPLPTGGNGRGNAATAVVWNPVRQKFYAAIRYHGYYESMDGVTWSRLAQQPGASLSLTACPTNPGTTGNSNCPIFRGALAVQPASGDTFALTVNNNNIDQGLWQDVCALSGSACSAAVSFGKRLDSTPLEVGNGSTAIPQADYNLALSAVASVNGTTGSPDTLLFVGTADLYRCSLSSGCSLRNTTNATNGCAAPAGVAGAQHAIASLATGSLPLVYLGNDGGLWRSTDGVNQQGTPCSPDDASHFQNLNGGLGSLAEVVSFAQHPTDANTILAGFGANGSAGTSAAGSTTSWGQLSTGEGSTVAIDPVDPQNWYLSTAAGVSIRQCGKGSACTAADFTGAPTIGLAQVADDASLIDPPWLLDPSLSSDVLIGTCRVWRGPASSGALWSSGNAISTMLAGPQNSACTTTNPVLRSLAAGGPVSGATAAQDTGSTILYAGMAGTLDGGGTAGGHLFATTAAQVAGNTTAWTDLTGMPVTNGGGSFNPDGFDLSSLMADPHDTTGQTIYATVMGFGSAHLYRSTDAGRHWTNISSNLPNAPANSVVVDPNDANTLYIAMDTGVYVTSQVTTCTSTNCWSIYGVGLPNAPVTQLAVSGAMPTGDGRFGELRAGTYGRGIWELPLLTAATSIQSTIGLNPTSLTFNAQAVGTTSAPQPITVTNTGSAPLVISSVTITGGAGIPISPLEQDFTETDTCIATPIAINASCTVEVGFLPIATGTRTGVLTIFGNIAGGQATVSLFGNGTPAASIVLTPTSLTYPATVVGATSVAENITISNQGGTQATLQTPVVTGDFRISVNTCGSTLAAGSGCTVAIAFAPTASGTRQGALTVTDSAGTQMASLIGIGTSPATDALAPLGLVFAAQQLNTVSVAQQVTLTNAGDVALTLIAAQITAGDFIVANSCGNSLNAHSSCAVAVSYVPKNVGNETGTLTISDQYRSQTISLSGFGVAPPGVSLAPVPGLSFGPLGVGIISSAQTVTLTNNGGLPLTLNGLTLTGDFVILSGGNTCGTSVPANAACTLQIAFMPTAAGTRTGLLTVLDNAASSPQTLTLTGTGVDFSLVAGNSSASVTSGQSAVYPLLLSSVSGVPGAASFTCSGVPANATCLVVPGTVQLGTGTATVTVTVATGVASASLLSGPRTIWIALALPFVFGVSGWRRRSALGRLMCLIVLCSLFVAAGCGSSRLIPSSGSTNSTTPSTPTPSGTSTIVVSAASAGLVRTVNLNLTVQ